MKEKNKTKQSKTKVSTGIAAKEKRQSTETLAGVLRRPRYEVIPLQGAEEVVVEHVPKDIKLTVTSSPQKGIEATLGFAERLSKHGHKAVPHLSARLVIDEAHLKDILQRLHESDIREIFVVAGDVEEPAGKFAGADELLPAMAELGHGLDEIGITGYPESHPIISDQDTIQAMYDKAPYATYIVSQICFDPEVIFGWIRRVRRRGNWVLRMFLPGGYSPDDLIEGLAHSLGDPRCKVHGFHIYTFNEVEETEAWRREKLDNIGAA